MALDLFEVCGFSLIVIYTLLCNQSIAVDTVGEDVEFDIEVNEHDESKRSAKDVTGPNGADVLGGIRPPRPEGSDRRERNRF